MIRNGGYIYSLLESAYMYYSAIIIVTGNSIQICDHKTQFEHIYNPITAMGFSAMFTFQLDNTKR